MENQPQAQCLWLFFYAKKYFKKKGTAFEKYVTVVLERRCEP
jgi:hypothetical protein